MKEKRASHCHLKFALSFYYFSYNVWPCLIFLFKDKKGKSMDMVFWATELLDRH